MLSDSTLPTSGYDHQEAVKFVSDLPSGVVGSFSYGSAVFSQPGASTSATKHGAQKSMIDIILIVRNAIQWHEQVSIFSEPLPHANGSGRVSELNLPPTGPLLCRTCSRTGTTTALSLSSELAQFKATPLVSAWGCISIPMCNGGEGCAANFEGKHHAPWFALPLSCAEAYPQIDHNHR